MQTSPIFKTVLLATATFCGSYLTSQNAQGQSLDPLRRIFEAGEQMKQEDAAAAKQDLIKSVKRYNINTVRAEFMNQPSPADPDADEQALRDDADIYSGLLFYCDPKLFARVKNIQSADGKKLFQEITKKNKPHIVAWQADENLYDTLEVIYRRLTDKNKFQIASVYNPRKNILANCLGGTNLGDWDDAYNAAIGISGLVTPRSADGAVYGQKVIDAFFESHPEMKGKAFKKYAFTHSQGGAALAGLMVAFAGNKLALDRAMAVMPYAARAAADCVEETLDIPKDVFERRITTILTKTPQFPETTVAGKPIGNAKRSVILQNHSAENMTRDYNVDRVNAYNRKKLLFR